MHGQLCLWCEGQMTAEEGLLEPEVWKAILKLKLAEEWKQSLRESHAPSRELDHVLNDVDRECNLIAYGLSATSPKYRLNNLSKLEEPSRLKWI